MNPSEMKSMSRRERCLAAIAGKPVDRLPTYLPGIACDVASKLLGRPVHTGTGSLHYAESCAWMNGETAHDEFVHQLYEDLRDLYRLLDIDVYRSPWRHTTRPTRRIDEYTFLYGDPDGAHEVYRFCPESGDFGPIAEAGPPGVSYEDSLRLAVEEAEACIARGEQVGGLPDFMDDLHARFGAEFFIPCPAGSIGVHWAPDELMLLLTNPDLLRRKVMVQARRILDCARQARDAGMPLALQTGGDMAGARGPVYAPAHFREIVVPGLQWLREPLAAMNAHLSFASDGDLWPVADMLFTEGGCPGFAEADRDAGMGIAALRARYPRLIIWGNMSVRQLALRPTAWIREEAQRVTAEAGGTGYFHGPSNGILTGTPPENVIAMFEVR